VIFTFYKLLALRRTNPKLFALQIFFSLLLTICYPISLINGRNAGTTLPSSTLHYFTQPQLLHQNTLLLWWKEHPDAPRGLSCSPDGTMTDPQDDFDAGGGAFFPHRVPKTAATVHEKRQLAFVVPFVDFQIDKLRIVISKHWANNPPCSTDKDLDADLIFVTPVELSNSNKDAITKSLASLAAKHVGCFANRDSLIFMHTGSIEKEGSFNHLEGAAFAFYTLFPLLEQEYNTLFLAEPDLTPVQPGWLAPLVEESKRVNCDDGGLWQIGSVPLDGNVNLGTLRKRVDYHLNGNALYALGCAGYEDYKCRVQTFYVPKDECSLVGGCSTYETHES
jgi:hypothetical protein